MVRMMMDFAIAAGLVATASGHGQMLTPEPRPAGGSTENYKQREPVSSITGPVFGYSTDGGFRCRDTATPSATIAAYAAGQTVELGIKHEAAHPGDCSAWISYDCQGITGDCNPVNFFKVAAFPGCGAGGGIVPPNQFTLSFTLPAELPACDHCVLRWEWISLQQVSNIEAYVQCSDVSIASSAGPTKPDPLVAINGIGHLPSDINAYRKVYNPDGAATEANQVGPPVATYSTCAAGSANCLSSAGSGPVDPPPAPTPPTPTDPAPTPPTPTDPAPTPPTPTDPAPTPPTPTNPAPTPTPPVTPTPPALGDPAAPVDPNTPEAPSTETPSAGWLSDNVGLVAGGASALAVGLVAVVVTARRRNNQQPQQPSQLRPYPDL